ncbi:hypothetical protein L3Q82_016254 [Scortum barcoo]|uniref:Uncharacterized protein n=1 Tax=Scortum barcoo TaxID=214431 RepID=A0ACB8VRJ2_9TELE|nr:hypothetical protein L3Q82_016254 [Scortum barcoo]
MWLCSAVCYPSYPPQTAAVRPERPRACIEEGGNLASIPDKAAYDNIKLTIQRATDENKRAWVGGHDTVKVSDLTANYFKFGSYTSKSDGWMEGLWLWTDGTKFEVKEWGTGQPNNNKDSEDCMEINFNVANVSKCILFIVFEEMASGFHLGFDLCLISALLILGTSICISLGGNLASIHSAEEFLFVKELIHKGSGLYTRSWIGGHDGVKEGLWMWTDGSRFDHHFWDPWETNNHGGVEHCVETNFIGKDIIS